MPAASRSLRRTAIFIDIGAGWYVNLAYVSKIEVIDMGPTGTAIRFYSPDNTVLAECTPPTPEAMQQITSMIQNYGRSWGESEVA